MSGYALQQLYKKYTFIIMNNEILSKLGLSETQTSVLLCIIEQGKANPALIAKQVHITRPTAYNVIEFLKSRGLIEVETKSSGMYCTPARPESLRALVQKQKQEVSQKEEAVEEFIKQLPLLRKDSGYQVPEFRFIDESHFEDFIFSHTPLWHQSMIDTGEVSWWGIQDHSFIENYEHYFLWHWKVAPKKIENHLFTNNTEAEVDFGKKITSHVREMKYWEGGEITTTQCAAGDYLIIWQTKKHPHYGIEIHDRMMADNYRLVMKKLWGFTK